MSSSSLCHHLVHVIILGLRIDGVGVYKGMTM
jgi:hypothetical protein